MPEARPSYYLGKMDELRAARSNTCAIDPSRATCSAFLDFAHLVPTEMRGRGRGKADRYHDIKRQPWLFILICKRHHRKLDHQFWRWVRKNEERVREDVLAEQQEREEKVPF